MSNYSDRELECVECHEKFVFTARDQEFYAQQKFTDPKRCKDCRKAVKDRKKAAHAR